MRKFVVDTKAEYPIQNEDKIYNTLFDDTDANENWPKVYLAGSKQMKKV